jgi:hypothetical protein
MKVKSDATRQPMQTGLRLAFITAEMPRGRVAVIVKGYGTLAIIAIVLMGAVLFVRAHNTELTRFVEERPFVARLSRGLRSRLDTVAARRRDVRWGSARRKTLKRFSHRRATEVRSPHLRIPPCLRVSLATWK